MRRAAVLMIAGCYLFQVVRASDVGPQPTTREVSAKAEAEGDSKEIERPFTLDSLAGIESRFPGLLERPVVDLSETVIRIYDANGKQFTERKFQFGAIPRNITVKMARRAERKESYSRPDGESASLDPLTYTGTPYDAQLYSAFLFAQDGRGPNVCD